MKQKASDLTCIPLTRAEHVEYHQVGRLEFERGHSLDIGELVRRLNSLWFRERARRQA